MARTTQLAPGEFYHVYNRGTDKRDIFLTDADRDRFLALLYLCNRPGPADLKLQGRTLLEIDLRENQEPLVHLTSYCLMPNHFHLLIRECDNGGISKFMQKVTTGYTMYFNKRYDRSGTLFQGKFKASHIDNDRYLKYLIAYIHLNPIKLIEPRWKETGIPDRSRAQKYLESYAYSSYLDYLGQVRQATALLERDALPDYFSSGADFKAFVNEWLDYMPE